MKKLLNHTCKFVEFKKTARRREFEFSENGQIVESIALFLFSECFHIFLTTGISLLKLHLQNSHICKPISHPLHMGSLLSSVSTSETAQLYSQKKGKQTTNASPCTSYPSLIIAPVAEVPSIHSTRIADVSLSFCFSEAPLLRLPKDILNVIISFLSFPQDACSLARACKQLRALADGHSNWVAFR